MNRYCQHCQHCHGSGANTACQPPFLGVGSGSNPIGSSRAPLATIYREIRHDSRSIAPVPPAFVAVGDQLDDGPSEGQESGQESGSRAFGVHCGAWRFGRRTHREPLTCGYATSARLGVLRDLSIVGATAGSDPAGTLPEVGRYPGCYPGRSPVGGAVSDPHNAVAGPALERTKAAVRPLNSALIR